MKNPIPLLVLSLSTLALAGAPCPALDREDLECNGDNDCDDDEECSAGECVPFEGGEGEGEGEGEPTEQETELCIRSLECSGSADPAGECATSAAEGEDDPVQQCVRALCGPELASIVQCAVTNGSCIDGNFDIAADGACADSVSTYSDCFLDNCGDVGEGEGEPPPVCEGLIGRDDGCDCGCGEHDPDCDAVGGGCDAAGCCLDPPQNGCEFCN